MKNLMAAFCADDSGVAAIEYGLLAVFIVVAMIAAATLLGAKASGVFDTIAASLLAAM
jgi:pilus assembly protein Flp/PilA